MTDKRTAVGFPTSSNSVLEAGAYLPPSPLGIPFFARLRNEQQTLLIASYTKLKNAMNDYLDAETKQVNLKVGLIEANTTAVARVNKIEHLRATEEERIQYDYDEIQHRSSVRAMSRAQELLEAEHALNAARAALSKTEALPPRASGLSDELNSVLAEAQSTGSAFDAYIDTLIVTHGGDENTVPEDVRQQIDHLRALKAHKVAAIYEKLR